MKLFTNELFEPITVALHFPCARSDARQASLFRLYIYCVGVYFKSIPAGVYAPHRNSARSTRKTLQTQVFLSMAECVSELCAKATSAVV